MTTGCHFKSLNSQQRAELIQYHQVSGAYHAHRNRSQCIIRETKPFDMNTDDDIRAKENHMLSEQNKVNCLSDSLAAIFTKERYSIAE